MREAMLMRRYALMGFLAVALAGFGVRAEEFDDAAWIGESAEALAPRFLKFRCSFAGESEPLKVALSADPRYILLLDGKVVGRGPANGAVEHWYYQTLVLEPGSGEHLLEAVVWNLSDTGKPADRPSAHLSWKTGFILKAFGPYDAKLTTGKSDWSVAALEGTAPDGGIASSKAHAGAFGVGCQFKVAGASVLDEVPPSGRFRPASILRGPGTSRHSRGGTLKPGWKVFPSALPEQLHRTIRPGETPHPFVVKSHAKEVRIFDLGNFYCAYPMLRVKGGRGAKVTWGWTEALRDPTITDSYSWRSSSTNVTCSKTDRSKREGMVFSDEFAAVDTFLPDGRDSALFSTPWWRCGRWCRISVETADEPIEIVDCAMEETRYPLEQEGSFETDDPTLAPIMAMSVRGVQMCAHEIMFDCPFWEQQMYPGDSRVAFLAMAGISSDDRLMRQGLANFDYSRRADGSLHMNWPSNHDQYSPTWTFSWVMSVGDHSRWHDDVVWLRERLPGIEHTMMSFARHENKEGLLCDLPGWNYLDWVVEWRPYNFSPPGSQIGGGGSAVVNLLYVRAMMAAADVYEACGDDGRASIWRAKAKRTALAIRKAYMDERRGLIADTIRKDAFSEHAQALAITVDCLEGVEKERALTALADGNGLAVASSFCLHYVFEAFEKAGCAELLLGKLDCWRKYVAMNMCCPLEGLVFPRSDCHAFGAHPLFHFHAGLAGVTPAAPRFAKIRVAPRPGHLRSIRARTPHPRGFVATEFAFAPDGSVSGAVTLPETVMGVFVWNGKEISLNPGRNVVSVR